MAALLEPEALSEPQLIAAVLAGFGLVAAAYLVPWDSLPAWAQLLPLLGGVLVLVLFDHALGDQAGVAPPALLPVVWFALCGTVREFAAALVLAVTAVVLWESGLGGFGSRSLALAVLIAMVAFPLYRRIRQEREQRHLESLALSAPAQLFAEPGRARADICAAASRIAGPASSWLLEPTDGGGLRAVAFAGTDVDWVALEPGEPSGAMTAFITGEGRFVSDTERGSGMIAQHVAQAAGARSVLFEPVLRQDHQPIGVLVVAWKRRIRRLSDPAIAAARLLAAQASTAIEREERIAELEQAREEAERARDAKSELLSQASHDLRTPLNAILGFSTLARRQTSDPELVRSLEQISQAGRYMHGLVTRMVEMQLSASGRLKLSLGPVHLDDFLRDACALVELRAEVRQVTLESDAPSLTVLGDRERLIQVMVNLIGNAVEASPAGTLVRVIAQSEDDTSRLRLSVIDEGPGISEAEQDRVFEPFTRLPADRRGYGLGLAIVKGMVDAMGGVVTLDSTVGQGSTFSIELPLVLPEDAGVPSGGEAPAYEAPADEAPADEAPADEAPVARAPTAPSVEGRAATVLYVEDNAVNADLVDMVLRAVDGIHYVWVETALAGLERARALRPALIMIDLGLPDLDGRELVRRLRADPETRGLPLVAVSASADIYEAELRELGVNAMLTKPFEADALIAIVRSLLPHTEAQASLST